MDPWLVLAMIFFQASFLCEAATSRNSSCTKIYGESGLHARCTIESVEELSTILHNPNDVKSLSIFSSDLETIPEGAFRNFTSLVNLSLPNNSIRTIKGGAFSGLNHLQRLELSGNQLIEWEGNFTNSLPSLILLDLSGNSKFVLPTFLLKLRMLKEIKGVTWNDPCANCSLVKNHTLKEGEFKNNEVNIETSELRKGDYLVGNMGHCRVNRLEASQEVVEYAKRGFFPRCLEIKACFDNEIRVTPLHRCWDIDNKILSIEFLIAPIAMILNLTVIVVTLTTRVLRRNVTMCLTSNMALSDFLVSLYTLILVCTRLKPYTEFMLFMKNLCNALGFIWLSSAIVSIKTSLILTVERYLVVVYCMQPSLRITRKIAFILVLITWCLGVSIAVLPLVNISVYDGNTFCIPIRPIKDIPHSYELSIGLSLWGIVLYFITIPFYIKVFKTVKETEKKAGIKRDGTLARRIGTLVLSNMIFFLVPIVIAFLWLTTNIQEVMSPQSREILTGVLPTILFSFNSLINPLLYAFRAEKFRKAIKIKIDYICLRKGRSTSLTSSLSGRLRGPTVSSNNGGGSPGRQTPELRTSRSVLSLTKI